ncbi:MAG: hypothetical protein KJZ80_18365, partial [Hyphomicrobiaceae bacterium]|nr:hypothetical protein [Hyphomicrobiaceae bacterium]
CSRGKVSPGWRVFQRPARYCKKHKSFSVMQNTIRYLSGGRIVLPEGFLTACNVIESIGKAAPNSKADLPSLLKLIAKRLRASDRALAERFNKEVRTKIFHQSSFKDRFEHVKTMLQEVGTPATLKHDELSVARAAYRHDIIALKPEHFGIMRAGIGLSWFLGLVWMCREIGISESMLSAASSRDLFHRQRGTGRELWGNLKREAV